MEAVQSTKLEQDAWKLLAIKQGKALWKEAKNLDDKKKAHVLAGIAKKDPDFAASTIIDGGPIDLSIAGQDLVNQLGKMNQQPALTRNWRKFSLKNSLPGPSKRSSNSA